MSGTGYWTIKLDWEVYIFMSCIESLLSTISHIVLRIDYDSQMLSRLQMTNFSRAKEPVTYLVRGQRLLCRNRIWKTGYNSCQRPIVVIFRSRSTQSFSAAKIELDHIKIWSIYMFIRSQKKILLCEIIWYINYVASQFQAGWARWSMAMHVHKMTVLFKKRDME